MGRHLRKPSFWYIHRKSDLSCSIENIQASARHTGGRVSYPCWTGLSQQRAYLDLPPSARVTPCAGWGANHPVGRFGCRKWPQSLPARGGLMKLHGRAGILVYAADSAEIGRWGMGEHRTGRRGAG